MMEHVQTIISDIRLEWGRGTIGRIKHRANIFVFPLRKKLPMFLDFDSLVCIFKSSVLKVFRPLWNEKLGRDDHRLNNEFTIPFSIRQSQNKTTKLCIIIVQILGSLSISKYNTEVKIISRSIFFFCSVCRIFCSVVKIAKESSRENSMLLCCLFQWLWAPSIVPLNPQTWHLHFLDEYIQLCKSDKGLIIVPSSRDLNYTSISIPW